MPDAQIATAAIAFAAGQQVLPCKQNLTSQTEMCTFVGNPRYFSSHWSVRLAASHVHTRPRCAGDGRRVGHAVMVPAATLLTDHRNYRVALQLLACQRSSAHSVATCILGV